MLSLLTAGIVSMTIGSIQSADINPYDIVENYDSYVSDDYIEMSIDIADEYNIAPALIVSIIENDSNGNPNAIDILEKGTVGLCQVNPEENVERMENLGVTDIYDPYSNILVCADYLYDLFLKYEDLGLVLTAYIYDEGSPEFYTTKATGHLTDEVEAIIGRSDALQIY